jgi:hypothetical protein
MSGLLGLIEYSAIDKYLNGNSNIKFSNMEYKPLTEIKSIKRIEEFSKIQKYLNNNPKDIVMVTRYADLKAIMELDKGNKNDNIDERKERYKLISELEYILSQTEEYANNCYKL